MSAIKNKYDFVFLFDASYSNPNGDPDSDNEPRIDPTTGLCLVTDVCIKRKIRNYIDLRKDGDPNYKLYIKNDSTLNAKEEEAFAQFGFDDKSIVEERKSNPDIATQLREFMCNSYFDLRAFGGVLTKFMQASLPCSGIKGPVQVAMAQSISPVEVERLTVSRCAVATSKEAEKASSTFGSKSVIRYGLFRLEGSISAAHAQKYTGFSDEDLELLWEALINLFEEDKSAIRSNMRVRELVVFKHEGMYGSVPSYKLTDRVIVKEKTSPVKSYDDYTVEVNTDGLPDTVTCTRMI